MAFMQSKAGRPLKELIAQYPKIAGRQIYSYEIPYVFTMGGGVLEVVRFFRPPASADFLALEFSISSWKYSIAANTLLPTVEFQDMSNNSYQGNPTYLDLVAGPGHQGPTPGGQLLTEPKYMDVYLQGDGLLRATFRDDPAAISRQISVTLCGLVIR